MPNYTGDIDLEQNQILNTGLEVRADDPTTNLFENRTYYSSTYDTIMVYEGGNWLDQLRPGINTLHPQVTDQGIGVYHLNDVSTFVLNEIAYVGESRTIIVDPTVSDWGDPGDIIIRSCGGSTMSEVSIMKAQWVTMLGEIVQPAVGGSHMRVTIYTDYVMPGDIIARVRDTAGNILTSGVFRAGDVAGTAVTDLPIRPEGSTYSIDISNPSSCSTTVGVCPNGNIFGELHMVEPILGLPTTIVPHNNNTIRGNVIDITNYKVLELMAVTPTEWVLFGDSEFHNLDNTADADKPISIPQLTYLNLMSNNTPRFDWVDSDPTGQSGFPPNRFLIWRGDGNNLMFLSGSNGDVEYPISAPTGVGGQDVTIISDTSAIPARTDQNHRDLYLLPDTNSLYINSNNRGDGSVWQPEKIYFGFAATKVTQRWKTSVSGTNRYNMPRGIILDWEKDIRVKCKGDGKLVNIIFFNGDLELANIYLFADGDRQIVGGPLGVITTATTLSVTSSVSEIDIELDMILDFPNHNQLL